MNKWTIKMRIIAGFAALVVIFTVVAASSMILLKQINGHQDDVTDHALPGVTTAGNVKYLACEIELGVVRHIFAKTPEEKKKFDDDINSGTEKIQKVFDDYEKTIVRTDDREQFKKLVSAREGYIKIRSQALELSRAGKDAEVLDLTRASLRPAYAGYIHECEALFDENAKFATESSDASHKAMGLANTLILSLTAVTILLGIASAYVIVTGINRVLNHVASSLDEGSSQVGSAANQVSGASQSLAEGASEQAASLEETSSSLEEMASMTKRNSENAQKANELAKHARSAADKGANDMRAMSTAMEAIKVSSDDIAKIIKTIDEIAFQTNILALNAAVEAARAGEAGMGFAVVADEVRNLAQRSAQAAKETAGKIEGAIAKTGQGVDISTTVAQTLNDIVTKVRQVDELVGEVASASREQTQGISQINTAVSQMDKVTQSNAANAEESAAAAEELNSQAEVMKHSVAELLELVGGATARKAPVSKAPEKAIRPSSPAVKRTAAAPARKNGNGHAPTAPPVAAASQPRGGIPMDGDFTSF